MIRQSPRVDGMTSLVMDVEPQIDIERERTLQAKEKTKQLRLELQIKRLEVERQSKRKRNDQNDDTPTPPKIQRSHTDVKATPLIKTLPSVHTVFYQNQLYYKVNDIASILGYTDLKQAGKKHIPAHLRFRGKEIGLYANQNDMAAAYTTEEGAASLIHLSRLPNSVTIAEAAGLPIALAYKRYHHETHHIGVICRAFRGHEMRREYTVGQYRVDLFFPKYRLIIECDEHGHTSYNADSERTRSEILTQALNASWIRFNPDQSDFCIIDVINQVHTHIVQCRGPVC